jgi:hypothetical protein
MSICRRGAVIAVLALIGLAPTPSFGDILPLTVTGYDSPTFADGSSFNLGGRPGGSLGPDISLTPGVSQKDFLDWQFATVSGSGGSFSGDASGTMTLGGVSLTFSDSYTFAGGVFSVPEFTGGPSIVFHLGAFDVTVTPIATDSFREATFLETPAAAVPEPSSALAVGFAALAGLGVWARRRRGAPRAG